MERMTSLRVKEVYVKWAAHADSGNHTDDIGGGSMSYGVVPPSAGTLEADPTDATGFSAIFTPAESETLAGGVQLELTISGGILSSPVTNVLTLTSQ